MTVWLAPSIVKTAPPLIPHLSVNLRNGALATILSYIQLYFISNHYIHIYKLISLIDKLYVSAV